MQQTIAIVGLGYVGLPLAHAFTKNGYRVLGYDVNEQRIRELKEGKDRTHELSEDDLKETRIEFSANPSIIQEADIVIVALPTPIDKRKKPDLTILKAGTETVGKHMKGGAIVVFESTVYPGTTEEICGPILSKASGGKSFKLGYSPERINPGDREHTVTKILKVVSGEDEETLNTLSGLYESIIEAGVHRAPSIKVAEMAKAIENAQRDLNIAFVNEIAMMCHKLGISSKDVLEAAKTKWNFLPFLPGLVGGHCIGVDPYYLVEKAKQLGMDTNVITAGRSVNDSMGAYVALQVGEALGNPKKKRVLVLGLTFKENVPDMRNSQSQSVIDALERQGCIVEKDDPYQGRANKEGNSYDAIVLLVPHREYLEMTLNALLNPLKKGGVVYDLKSLLDSDAIERMGYRYKAL